MCGITGWIDFNQSLDGGHGQMQKMCNSLIHRGPDAQGIWQGEHVLLGHRRLAVIDLEGGIQPMIRTVHDHRYVLTYNGELYNTEELKAELISKGYIFTTTSDTEVLLMAFIEWREHVVDYLNGIFAFAVWDEREQSLYAFRDRLGVKPFYYYAGRGMLLFASELKAILAHEAVQPIMDSQALSSILSLGPSHEPGKTPFSNIQELPPSYRLKMTAQQLDVDCYWTTPTLLHPHDEQETAMHVRELLVDAIERQLVSDVPLCTFLSGGIDSSIITAVAANYYKQRGEKLHTYSIDYENHAQSFQQNEFQTSRDQYWINLMQNHSDTVHHNVTVSTDELLETLLAALYLKDMPSMVDIDSSLLVFAKNIKQDFTVGLSGECADELFGGYRWFYGELDGFPWIRSIEGRERLLNESWREKLKLSQYLQDVYEKSIAQMPQFDENPIENKRQQLFLLNRQYFMQTLLQRKDSMTMGASLEVRVPFADHRLVEYVWNIPWEIKTTGNLEKGILRKAVEGLVPHDVLYRKKNPYPKTYDPRYTEGVTKMLVQCLQNKQSILHELFDREQLQALIDSRGASFQQPWFGQLMAGPQLIAYFVQFHYWFEHYGLNIA